MWLVVEVLSSQWLYRLSSVIYDIHIAEEVIFVVNNDCMPVIPEALFIFFEVA